LRGIIDWLKQHVYTVEWGWRSVLLGVGVFVVTFTASIAAVSYVLVKLPPTYFQAAHSRDFWIERHPVLRWTGIIVKNLFGLLLVALGVVMALPGVPGQGVLTILLGLMLMDFPGKRALEYKLVSRPRVLHAINALRARFDKPPIVLDEQRP
jgi:hypothetical protein